MTFVAAPNPSSRTAKGGSNVRPSSAQTHSSSSLSSQPITMECILERAISEKGITSGTGGAGIPPVSLDQVIDVWNAICRVCEETLLRGHTLVVPGFANIGVKKEVEHMGGIWKPKTSLTPSITLSPTFVSQYCSDRFPTNTTDVKHGKTSPVMLNPSTVSCYSGVGRHQCQHLLKDAVRAIGQTLLQDTKNKTILVELGFATLEFSKDGAAGGKGGYHVRWDQEFLAEFNDAMAEEAGTLQKRSERVSGAPSHYVRPSSAGGCSNGSSTRSPRSARQSVTPQMSASKAAAFASANPRSSSPRVPKPPGAPLGGSSAQGFRPKAGLGITGASAAQKAAFDANRGAKSSAAGRSAAAPPRTPPLPFAVKSDDVGSRCSSANSSRCGTPRLHHGATYQSHPELLRAYANDIHQAARGAQPRRPSTAQYSANNDDSPRSNNSNWNATLNTIARSGMTPFTKQKARKAIYRRMRGQAFEDSWSTQLQMKKQREKDEKDAEKRRIEQFRRAMGEQAAKEYNEKMEQRNEEREVASLNAALVHPRRAMQLPRAASPGDLFSSRIPPSRPPSRTKEILEIQMEEVKARKQKESDDNRNYQRTLREEDNRYHESQKQDKVRRRQDALRMREEHHEQMEAKKREEERFKATMPKSGCILYSEDESALDEAREMMEVKIRTREFQRENKRFIDEKHAKETRDAAERHFTNAERRQRERDEESARVLRERQDRAAVQVDMRASWIAQMDQRKRRAEQERADRAQWRDHTYLKNESSDDDDG